MLARFRFEPKSIFISQVFLGNKSTGSISTSSSSLRTKGSVWFPPLGNTAGYSIWGAFCGLLIIVFCARCCCCCCCRGGCNRN